MADIVSLNRKMDIDADPAAVRIRVRGLRKRYGALEVFRDVDFDAVEAESNARH